MTQRTRNLYLYLLLLPIITAFLLCSCGGAGDDDDDSSVGDDDDVGDDDSVVDDDDDVSDDDDSGACGSPISFTEIVWSESLGDGTGNLDDCTEVNVELIDSQVDLETRFEEMLNNHYINVGVPTEIDFGTEVALLSYNTYCPGLGLELRVDELCDEADALVAYETLRLPDGYLAEVGRTFNLSSLPRAAYSGVSLELTVVYEKP